MTEDQAKQVVTAWRAANPRIAAAWGAPMRIYHNRQGGRLVVRRDRTCWVQAPWGGPFIPMDRGEAAKALWTCRQLGLLLHPRRRYLN